MRAADLRRRRGPAESHQPVLDAAALGTAADQGTRSRGLRHAAAPRAHPAGVLFLLAVREDPPGAPRLNSLECWGAIILGSPSRGFRPWECRLSAAPSVWAAAASTGRRR